MGGSVKQAFSNPIRGLTAVGTFGTSELARKAGSVPRAIAALPERASDAVLGTHYSDLNNPAPAKGGMIYNTGIDPYGDAQAINKLGSTNYDQSQELLQKNYKTFGDDQGMIQQASDADLAARAAARDKLAGLLQDQARQTFANTLPGTAEDYNAGGLLNSTGYQREVARQQANLAGNITNQLAQQGLLDVDLGSQYRQQALNRGLSGQDYLRAGDAASLAARQAMAQQGLQRSFSVNDFANAANTASIIGAQNAPNVGNGKAGTGAVLSGAGSLASGLGGLK